MKDDQFDPQAEALDKYLSASGDHLTPSENHPVFRRDVEPPAEEAQLAEAILHLAQEIQPQPDFEKKLEQQLTQTARRRNITQQGRPGPGCWLGLSGLALALFAGLAWIAYNLLFRAPPPTPTPAAAAMPTGAPTELEPRTAQPSLEPSVPPPLPTANPVYSLAIQPEVDFLLETAFPPAPGEVEVYRQAPLSELTLTNVRERALQLGVEGEVYQSQANRTTSYLVWDGVQKLTFFSSPDSFQYETGDPALHETPACPPPCLFPGAEEAFSGFLEQRGLTTFPMEMRPSTIRSGWAALAQAVEGRPLLYPSGAPQGEALINAQGHVLSLDYNPARLERLGAFPILTAEQAWLAATQVEVRRGVEIDSRNVPAAGVLNWSRLYRVGEPVEIFGYLSVYPSADGAAPLLMTGNLPLAGNTTRMENAALANPFLQIVGQIEAGDAGQRTLQVTGWQVSPFPYQSLSGRIERLGETGYLNTGERAYLLPDLPQNVPSEEILTVSGVVIEQPELTLSWSSITNESGGKTRSAGRFLDLNLPGGSRAAEGGDEPPAEPGRVGGRLDGAQGQPFVVIHEYSDGSTQAEVRFTLDPSADGEPATTFVLEGPGLAGIEVYHNLPLRIWGAFTSSADGALVFSLERYEPVYPGLRLQSWLGRYEPAALEGGEALLFVTRDGERLVLGSLTSQPVESLAFAPGDPLIVEGYLLPDQTFDGLPILRHTAIFPAQGVEELSEYALVSARPEVIHETGTAGAAKTAFIQSIELAYYTQNPRRVDFSTQDSLLYVQPVWRFSGAYEDGTRFEILVQALADEVLFQP